MFSNLIGRKNRWFTFTAMDGRFAGARREREKWFAFTPIAARWNYSSTGSQPVSNIATARIFRVLACVG